MERIIVVNLIFFIPIFYAVNKSYEKSFLHSLSKSLIIHSSMFLIIFIAIAIFRTIERIFLREIYNKEIDYDTDPIQYQSAIFFWMFTLTIGLLLKIIEGQKKEID
jgi:hypothetical protein